MGPLHNLRMGLVTRNTVIRGLELEALPADLEGRGGCLEIKPIKTLAQ